MPIRAPCRAFPSRRHRSSAPRSPVPTRSRGAACRLCSSDAVMPESLVGSCPRPLGCARVTARELAAGRRPIGTSRLDDRDSSCGSGPFGGPDRSSSSREAYALIVPRPRVRNDARSTAPCSALEHSGSAMSPPSLRVVRANAVDAPEKILDAVESCACVSMPITTSHAAIVNLETAAVGGANPSPAGNDAQRQTASLRGKRSPGGAVRPAVRPG